ncbi:unnamed protein product, partial [marine sediment metagenome]
RSLGGTFLLTEDLKSGQKYNVRAKLETLVDRTQETDTDWSVITITGVPPAEFRLTTKAEPIGAGRVFKEPNKTRYAYGEIVKLTADPYSGHRFTYWDVDGEYLDYINPINFIVLADHTVTAHFERI